MKPLVLSLFALGICGGCVSRCTVRDEPRRTVQFEDAATAQTFYDSYLRVYHATPQYFTVGVPLPYHHLKLGSENVKFNRAVEHNDTNGDNVISAEEARAFAATAERITHPSKPPAAPKQTIASAAP